MTPRLSWIAWLLILLIGFTTPVQAMQTINALPALDLSTTAKKANSAKNDPRSYPINYSDRSGRSALEDLLALLGAGASSSGQFTRVIWVTLNAADHAAQVALAVEGSIEAGAAAPAIPIGLALANIATNPAHYLPLAFPVGIPGFTFPSSSYNYSCPVNLASPQRTTHILYGDATGGGHMYPGNPGKSTFPQDWGPDEIMESISDIATDPSLSWIRQTGSAATGMYTSNGNPATFVVFGNRGGITIKVILRPAGEGIISGYPSTSP